MPPQTLDGSGWILEWSEIVERKPRRTNFELVADPADRVDLRSDRGQPLIAGRGAAGDPRRADDLLGQPDPPAGDKQQQGPGPPSHLSSGEAHRVARST